MIPLGFPLFGRGLHEDLERILRGKAAISSSSCLQAVTFYNTATRTQSFDYFNRGHEFVKAD